MYDLIRMVLIDSDLMTAALTFWELDFPFFYTAP